MTDSASPTPASQPQATLSADGDKKTKAAMPQWLLFTIFGVGGAALLVIAFLIASVTVPLVWANSIRDQVGSQLQNSIPLGMFYGFIFTFFPVLLVWQARRPKLNKWVRISLLAVGLLLTLPNLLTLAVLYGDTGTAADARATWATGANWFGTWSQLFMVIGVVSGVAVIVLGRMLLRRGKSIREFKAAQKLVRETEQAQARTAKENAKMAEKKAREDARAAEKAEKAAARANRRGPGGAPDNASSSGAGSPPEPPQA
ncbi:hypothetical protein [Arthrobacter glacialis]|uniref:Permease n=1 Tax=Arthrobacter glacialis TaxID=1664 RepID=A0A2S3ZUG3_ARTGL|nr:hypothetical protein [Arthrobacter glacialis]POH72868.1 hypothetical protein CVS27_13430 [Arthrobacter glacialis]